MADLLAKTQAAIPATTLTDVHTCPSTRMQSVTIFICNRAGATTFRLSVAAKGTADATKQYIYYDTAIAANTTVQVSITLDAADVIRVYAGSANLSVNVFIDESFVVTTH